MSLVTAKSATSNNRLETGRPLLRALAAKLAALLFAFGLVAGPDLAAEAASEQDARVEAASTAGAFLQQLGEKAVVDLTDNEISEEERESRFRALFTAGFDTAAISRFVLGAQWRKASEAQREEFLAVFEDAVVQRFLPMFAQYSGETFTIGQERRDEGKSGHIFVPVMITPPKGEPFRVDWRLREVDSSYKIIDILAEGVSLALTLRQEYGAFVKRNGMDELIKLLRNKVAAGAFAPKAQQ